MSVREITLSDLRQRIVPRRIPRSEEYRTYYGRSLDMRRLESAIRQAECGHMAPITDLESETLSLDAHVQALAAKRFGVIQSVPWGLTPAKGPGIDPALAEECHAIVQAQLAAIPCFGERLYDLAWAEYDGRGALELEWDQRPGKVPWWIQGLHWIHPRRLSFDRERNLRLIDTWHHQGGFAEEGLNLADVPAKFIWWMPRLFREYPEREGLAPRSLYWCFFKRFSWRHRLILIELFAVPWRIVKASSTASPDGLKEAEEAAQRLGRDTTARFEEGIDLDVVFPHENSGNLFQMTSDDVDKQMSKLWLGNTGTTESDETTRAGGIVAKSEQEIHFHRLGEGLSGRVQEQLVTPIVALNRGYDAISHAPRFEFDTAPPRDRDKDMARIERAVALQVPVAIDEIRETAGTREPDPKEAYAVGSRDAAGNVVVSVVDPNAAPTDVDDAATSETRQDEGGISEAGERADDERDAMVAAIVRRAGISEEAAKRAYLAARAGSVERLRQVPGLGLDDTQWLLEVVPRTFVVEVAGGELAGIRQLARLRGIELEEEAIAALGAMPAPTRHLIVEELLTNADRHRPLDP